MRPIPNKQN